MTANRLLFSCCLLQLLVSSAVADEAVPTAETIRAAVAKSLPLLERGAKTSRTERKDCFTCHNQGLPIFALTLAKRRGFSVDDDELKAQLKFTADFLDRNREKYREGRGQPGQTFMAGYALWALKHGEWAPDDTTAAVAEYFLKFQSDQDHWSRHTQRPPSERSDFTANFLGLMSLKSFSTPDQQERVTARRDQVRQWLLTAKPEDTEDRVFRLWGLAMAEAPAEDLQAATNELLAAQRADGGWSQTESMESDAYATGTALVALHQAGKIAMTDERSIRGLAFLLHSQKDDGSWYVVSRSKPFQEYYESGYPHGKDQFISITAGGWATMALLLALPETP